MFNPTVSSIVSDLQEKCQQLLALSGDLQIKAAKKHDKATALIAERDAHNAEAERAKRVAAKVQALLD